jgi:peptidoglycan/LPS O-acetylase OafA/YrhL
MNKNYSKIRLDIQGLRGISVIAVVIYHAQIFFNEEKIFLGGFLGVDVFFVISGFIIGKILFEEIQNTQIINLKHFFLRRARRILPIFLIVILITNVLVYFVAFPDNTKEIILSSVFSQLSIANFFFYFEGVHYGSDASIYKPFLHTWSLSIEEQFYIFFPLLLILVINLKIKHQINFLLFLFFFFSFFSMLILNAYGKNQLNFYFSLTRFWEIIAGISLAYNINRVRFQSNFIDLISIIILMLLILFLPKNLHPSYITLFVIVPTILLLASSDKSKIKKIVLENKIMVFLGNISFSLYLIHWPIISILSYLTIYEKFSNIQKFFLISLFILIATLTYFFIEKFFRNKKRIGNQKFIIYTVSLFIITLLISVSIIKTDVNLINKKFFSINKNINQGWKLLDENNKPCHSRVDNYCYFNKNARRTIVLLGDSHMDQLAYNLKIKAIRNNYGFVQITGPGCLYVKNLNKFERNTKKLMKNCNKYITDKALKFISQLKSPIIISGGRVPLHLEERWFDNKEGGKELGGRKIGTYYLNVDESISLEKTITYHFENIAKKYPLVLIYPIPEVGWHVPRKINSIYVTKNLFNTNKFENYLATNPLTTSHKVFLKRSQLTYNAYNAINANFIKILPEKLFCKNKRCYIHDKLKLLYVDYDHLSKYGVNLLTNEIIKNLNQHLKDLK